MFTIDIEARPFGTEVTQDWTTKTEIQKRVRGGCGRKEVEYQTRDNDKRQPKVNEIL